MGQHVRAAKPDEHRNWANIRRKFTLPQVKLLLAGNYTAFAAQTGCKLSTARRYGHHVRHAKANGVTIVPEEVA